MTRSRAFTTVLIVLMSLAIIVVIGAAIVAIPILTHSSAGDSGQSVPDSFVSDSSATGADGRTRQISAETDGGNPADLSRIEAGERIIVHGTGFDAGIGIYVSVCEIPATPEEKPHPCLGGIPEGAESGDLDEEAPVSSAWVTNDWAWRAFATHRWESADDGSFTVELTVPPAADEQLDCTQTRCAITTRADHTAGNDRVQDMLLPVQFAK